ncbi:DUF4114 domain-containing protein [Plectonema radiosum NIES-515]|uniref:DUF4114 domain-containing protein n=1 Tax=Plectonema radiosum NIES-515 TaxID=2986073 RepID=A0ABT3AUP1_9CYAN|nr:DUF4114 domain-containing protein [Plectonema radiosum]MCV3212832.1 DUF4114 domain-containing protein [Plectonema radiosum NIES-515]
MKNKFIRSLLAAALGTGLLSIAAPANAFDIKSRDEAPADFKNILQDFRAFVGEERRYLSGDTIQAKQVNLSDLTLKFDYDPKVFFIGETAEIYRDRLDFTATTGSQVETGQIIFGDTSCNTGDRSFPNFSQFCPNPNDALPGKVAPDKPLNVGDWVNLGSFQAGTKLDFQLVANDINGGIYENGVKGVFGLNQAVNPDGLQHAIAYYYKDYLVLGFEDSFGGGDRDYNDTVFAIDIGKANARGVANVPEPSVVAAMFAIATLGLMKTRRRHQVVR